MPTTFVLGEDVDLCLELGVRSDAAFLGQHLSTVHFFLLGTTKQRTDVVAGLPLIESLLEHFDPSAGGQKSVLDPDDFNFVTGLENSSFDTTSHHGSTTCNGEHILHRHQEVLGVVAFWNIDVLIDGCQQLGDRTRGIGSWILQSLECASLDDRNVVSGELIRTEEFADFHLHQLDEFLVIDHVRLVHEHNDLRHADLTSEQDVLTSLGHRTICGGNDQNRSVHLGRTGDHVLDIVSVSRAIHMGVVTVFRLVLHMGGCDGDPTLPLFRRIIDLIKRLYHCTARLCKHSSDRSGQSRLAVVHVTNCPHIGVRLVAYEGFLRHLGNLPARGLDRHSTATARVSSMASPVADTTRVRRTINLIPHQCAGPFVWSC